MRAHLGHFFVFPGDTETQIDHGSRALMEAAVQFSRMSPAWSLWRRRLSPLHKLPAPALRWVSALVVLTAMAGPAPPGRAYAPRIRTAQWAPGGDYETYRAPFSFNALSLTWQEDGVPIQVRTRGDGLGWADWEDVEADDDGALPAGVRSALLALDSAREAQVRSATDDGRLPTGLRIAAVDTGESADIPTAFSAAQAGAPRIISRAEWGADPALMKYPPEYAPVRKFVVHHTATSEGGNNPTAALRAIYYQHAVVLEWGDIGYNYLIDRSGNIYEGRAGGPNSIGVHSARFNTGTDGIALLGTFTEQRPTDAMLASLASLIAWRGRVQGVDPLGSSTMYDVTLPNVLGHRDVMVTQCPGDLMYALLPAIRRQAAAMLRQQLTRPPVAVLSSRVTPLAFSSGDAVRVEVTLRNDGPEPVFTQGPDPSTIYAEGDTFRSLGHPEQIGRVRISAEVDGGAVPEHRYRWGLGANLAPGETRIVAGLIRFDRPGTHAVWLGVTHEAVEQLHDNLSRSPVNVYSPGAASYAAASAPSTDLYFPLAMKEHNGWSTRTVLQNTADRPAAGSLAFMDDQGRPAATVPVALPPRGSVVVDAAGVQPLRRGYTGAAIARADAPLAGAAFHERTGSDRLAVEPFAAGAPRLYAPLLSKRYRELDTGVQVQNLGGNSTTVSMTYLADTGGTWTETTRIEPLASSTFYAPANRDLPAGFVGSGIIESADGQPLAAQVNEVRSDGVAMAYPALVGGSPMVGAPLLFRNRNNWASGLQVQNLGGTPATAVATYVPTNLRGGPWEERGTIGHALSATFYLPATPFLPDDLVASATVRSLGGEPLLVLANSVNGAKRTGTVVGGASQGAALFVPWVANEAEGWRTGVQVQNGRSQPAPVTVSVYAPTGARVLQMEDVIPPSGAATYYAPALQGITPGFVGSMVVSGRADAALSAVVNDVR